MSWISGFGFGMSMGSILMSIALTLERKRTRKALEGLIEGGPFRLETHGGQPAKGADLVAALDVALTHGNTWAARNRKAVAIVTWGVALVIGATVAALVRW